MGQVTKLAIIAPFVLSDGAVSADAGTVKIMPIGDSITMGRFQGSQGTWPGKPNLSFVIVISSIVS